jgi:acetyl esterase/lipase
MCYLFFIPADPIKMLLSIIIFILAYIALAIFLPKGSILQELIQLPIYWSKVFQVNTNELYSEKYSFGPHRKQYLYYLSKNKQPSNQKQVIIYIHGGGWRYGSPEAFRPNAKFFIELGYDVFMPAHRKTPKYGYKDQIEDIALAVQKVKEIMRDKGMSNRQIIIGGISSGGNLSALLVYNNSILHQYGIDKTEFAGLFLLAAPLNIRLMLQTHVLRSFAGKPKQKRYNLANPYSLICGEEKIPHLIVHGERDGLVNYFSSLTFVDKFRALNPEYLEFHTIPDGSHLDAGKWMFREDEVGQKLRNWLSALS